MFISLALDNNSGVKKFTPKSVSGLIAWYDPGDLSSIAKDGTNHVSAMQDKSGNAIHLSQSTGLNQPVWQSDGSVLFDGVNHYLKIASANIPQPFTILMVYRNVTWTAGRGVLSGDGVNICGFRMQGSPPNEQKFMAPTFVGDNASMILNAFEILTMNFNGASSSFQFNNKSATTGNPGANGLTALVLGARGDYSSKSNIQFKAAAIYSGTLSSDTITKLKNYFVKKYSITL